MGSSQKNCPVIIIISVVVITHSFEIGYQKSGGAYSTAENGSVLRHVDGEPLRLWCNIDDGAWNLCIWNRPNAPNDTSCTIFDIEETVSSSCVEELGFSKWNITMSLDHRCQLHLPVSSGEKDVGEWRCSLLIIAAPPTLQQGSVIKETVTTTLTLSQESLSATAGGEVEVDCNLTTTAPGVTQFSWQILGNNLIGSQTWDNTTSPGSILASSHLQFTAEPSMDQQMLTCTAQVVDTFGNTATTNRNLLLSVTGTLERSGAAGLESWEVGLLVGFLLLFLLLLAVGVLLCWWMRLVCFKNRKEAGGGGSFFTNSDRGPVMVMSEPEAKTDVGVQHPANTPYFRPNPLGLDPRTLETDIYTRKRGGERSWSNGTRDSGIESRSGNIVPPTSKPKRRKRADEDEEEEEEISSSSWVSTGLESILTGPSSQAPSTLVLPWDPYSDQQDRPITYQYEGGGLYSSGGSLSTLNTVSSSDLHLGPKLARLGPAFAPLAELYAEDEEDTVSSSCSSVGEDNTVTIVPESWV